MPGTEQRAIAISVNSLCYSKFPFQYCFYESFFFFIVFFGCTTTWSSQARGHIRATVSTYITAAATPDPYPTPDTAHPVVP